MEDQVVRHPSRPEEDDKAERAHISAADTVQQRNEASIRRFVEEALNKGEPQIVDATRGEFAEGGKGRISELRAAFPDLVTEIHPIVAEGDWVAHRMLHAGP